MNNKKTHQAYLRYQLKWMLDHGYTLADLLYELDEWRKGDPDISPETPSVAALFADWEHDCGFGGSLWVCEDEWKMCEATEEELPAEAEKSHSSPIASLAASLTDFELCSIRQDIMHWRKTGLLAENSGLRKLAKRIQVAIPAVGYDLHVAEDAVLVETSNRYCKLLRRQEVEA